MRIAKTAIIVLFVISSFATYTGAAPQTGAGQGQAQDIWKPFRFFEGRWEGKGEGKSGISHGFINQYVSDGPGADGKTFVFVSEAIENIPAGFSARLTYRILDDSSFEQTFDLAPPGQELACYSKGVMKRVY